MTNQVKRILYADFFQLCEHIESVLTDDVGVTSTQAVHLIELVTKHVFISNLESDDLN